MSGFAVVYWHTKSVRNMRKEFDMTRTRTAPWDYEHHHKVDADYDVPICAKCGGLVIFKANGDTLCAKCGEGRGAYRVPLMSVRAARVSAFVRHPSIFGL